MSAKALSAEKLKVVLIESEEEKIFRSDVAKALKDTYGIDLQVVVSKDLGEDYEPVLLGLESTDVFFIGYSLSDNDSVKGSEIAAYLRGLYPHAYIVCWIEKLPERDRDWLDKIIRTFEVSKNGNGEVEITADHITYKPNNLLSHDFRPMLRSALDKRKRKTTT